MSGWGNQSGIAYQQAHAVLICLGLLDGSFQAAAAVGVESKIDAFDLELLDGRGEMLKALQIKNRQLEETWAPNDIYPLIKEWSSLAAHPPQGLELRLGGRLGPKGAELQLALRHAADGDPSQLDSFAAGVLSTTEMAAASAVHLVVDPTPTASLLTAGSQQAMSLLQVPRTGPDARAEADSVLGALYLLVTDRAGRPDPAERVVTQAEVARLFDLDVVELRQQWDAAARRAYQEAALRSGIPKTVTEDLRRQPTPIERAAVVQDDHSKPLADLLDEHSHALISGQSGSGKTTAALKLRNDFAGAGRTLVIANAEAYIPGRLPALVSDSVAVVIDQPVGMSIGRAILADPTATILFDGAAEMTVDQRQAFTDELTPLIHSSNAPRTILIGRDPAVLNSLLPHDVSKNAYKLWGIRRDQRESLVGDVLSQIGATDPKEVNRVSAQAMYALKEASCVPYLLSMATELIWYGIDIKSRAQMYAVFTEEMARRRGVTNLQFCLLALGVAFGELLRRGRRQCDQFDWRQLLATSSALLYERGVDIEASAIERLARRGGFVAYEHYDQTVRPVHDSLADYFAAMAVDKGLLALPSSVTENDTLQLQFLAEMSGVSRDLAELITKQLPFLSIAVASFDNGPMASDSPAVAARLLSNVIHDTGFVAPSVQIAESNDHRIFVLTNASQESTFISANDVASLLFQHGATESSGGPLRLAVTLWKQKLESQLEGGHVGWRIPETESQAEAAVESHAGETAEWVRRLTADLFPPNCRQRILDLALPAPLDVAIQPGRRDEDPYWPILFRNSLIFRVRVIDFESWHEDGPHTGWGSVDSIVRRSPEDTAKGYVLKAVNKAVEVPWLR